MACDPQSLVSQGSVSCLSCAVPDAQQLSIIIYELCLIAGQPTDKNSLQTLTNNARCLACSLAENGIATPGQQMAAAISILCQIAGLTPAPPPTPPAACSDADANAFLTASGISDSTTVNAICTLVTSLKTAGIWTLMDVIYPFVGGTSASNSYNLKNPAAFQITWHGNMSFSAAGPNPLDTTGFGDTGFNPFTASSPNYTQNSAGMGFYIVTGNNTAPMGVTDSANSSTCVMSPNNTLAATDTCVGPNTTGGVQTASASNRGFYFMSRTSNLVITLYAPTGTASGSFTSHVVPHGNFYVCAQNFIGGGVLGTGPLNFGCVCAGLNSTQEAALSSAVTAFNTSLSRS